MLLLLSFVIGRNLDRTCRHGCCLFYFRKKLDRPIILSTGASWDASRYASVGRVVHPRRGDGLTGEVTGKSYKSVHQSDMYCELTTTDSTHSLLQLVAKQDSLLTRD
jgi:hypothetical protein